MTEKPDKSQEEIKEIVSESVLADDDSAWAPAQDDATALEDIDRMLAEDDPEFLKQISSIKVDNSENELSIMGDVILKLRKPQKKPIRWKFHFHNLFALQDEPKKVFLFWSLLLLFGASLVYGSKVIDFYFNQGLFLRSFAEWNSDVQSYNPLTEAEPFYDNPRFAKNVMTMTKMFVNLKPSESSSANPMLALEVSVEGMSAEAIIEIKDREAEFKDILLRNAEEFSYDDLTSAEGKKALLDKFTSVINAHLSQGQIRRTMLSSFIIKP